MRLGCAMQALSACTALTRLDISCNRGSAPAAAAFAAAAPRWPRLRSLDASCTRWHRHDAFLPALATLTALTRLGAAASLPVAGGGDGAAALPALRMLVELNLSSNSVSFEGLAQIAPALQRLTQLDLSAACLSHSSCPPERAWSAHLSGLRLLSLSHLGGRGSLEESELETLKGLQHLDMLGLDDGDVRDLQGFAELTGLTSLALGASSVTARGGVESEALALAPAVRGMTALRALALLGSAGLDAAQQWASAWLQLPQLTSLTCKLSYKDRF
jgi:hypothetical protein